MRGASAVEEMLAEMPDAQLRVMVVWEPILWTDFKSPSGGILSRLSDRRVVQFWDRNHFIARGLEEALTAQGHEIDRFGADVLWDDVAVYAPGLIWTDKQPPPNYFDGPVYEVIPELRDAIQQVQSSPRASAHQRSVGSFDHFGSDHLKLRF